LICSTIGSYGVTRLAMTTFGSGWEAQSQERLREMLGLKKTE